jgi:hypothetical protein
MPGPLEVALDKIGQAITPPVLINENLRTAPPRQPPPQEIIDRFDYLRQRILLQDVIRQLRFLRVFTPPSVVSLLDDYRRTSRIISSDATAPAWLGRCPACPP